MGHWIAYYDCASLAIVYVADKKIDLQYQLYYDPVLHKSYAHLDDYWKQLHELVERQRYPYNENQLEDAHNTLHDGQAVERTQRYDLIAPILDEEVPHIVEAYCQ